MNNKEHIICILNNLITINKDRIIGYKEILHELNNSDEYIFSLLTKMIKQSEGFENELAAEIKQMGAEVEDKTSTAGIIYNTWMDIIYARAEETKPDIKNFCLELEDMTQKAYQSALLKIGKQENIYHIICRQKQELESSFNEIKSLK